MAYTAPPTKTPPTPTLAADWNTYIRDNFIQTYANSVSGMGQLIATHTLSAEASVSFATLGTWDHLGFVIYGAYADVGSDLQIRMNGDTSANYDHVSLQRTTSDVDASTGGTGATSIRVPNFLGTDSSNSSDLRGYIHGYRSTTHKKRVQAFGGGNNHIFSLYGSWMDNSAVTSVSFLFSSNNGTGVFSMYGIND